MFLSPWLQDIRPGMQCSYRLGYRISNVLITLVTGYLMFLSPWLQDIRPGM